MNKSTNITDKQNNQELIIEGAGCGSCVGKIEAALKRIDGVDSAEMNFALRTVSIAGNVDIEVLIKAVKTIGYNARCVRKKEIIMNKPMNSSGNKNSQALIIEGAGCAGCVSKIEAALKSINGVDSAEMYFVLRTVSVTGEVAPEVLIKAIETLGYNAENA